MTCVYCGATEKLSSEHYLLRCLGAFRGADRLVDRLCLSELWARGEQMSPGR